MATVGVKRLTLLSITFDWRRLSPHWHRALTVRRNRKLISTVRYSNHFGEGGERTLSCQITA